MIQDWNELKHIERAIANSKIIIAQKELAEVFYEYAPIHIELPIKVKRTTSEMYLEGGLGI